MKEALDGPRTTMSDARTDLQVARSVYAYETLTEGNGFLEDTGIMTPLHELVDLVREQHPDIQLDPVALSPQGGTYIRARWSISPVDNNPAWHAVHVEALPLAKRLIVAGATAELLGGDKVKDRATQEDALAAAYKNPMRLIDLV